MSFNNSPMTTIEGKCECCPNIVKKRVTTTTAKHMKYLTCSRACKRALLRRIAAKNKRRGKA